MAKRPVFIDEPVPDEPARLEDEKLDLWVRQATQWMRAMQDDYERHLIGRELRQFRSVGDSTQSDNVSEILNHPVFAMSFNQTRNLAMSFHVPNCWDIYTSPNVHVLGFTNNTDTAASYRFEFGIEITRLGEAVTGVDDQTITFTQPAPDGDKILLITDPMIIDHETLGLQKNDHMNVDFRRIGGDPADDRNGSFYFLHAIVVFPRETDNLEITT